MRFGSGEFGRTPFSGDDSAAVPEGETLLSKLLRGVFGYEGWVWLLDALPYDPIATAGLGAPVIGRGTMSLRDYWTGLVASYRATASVAWLGHVGSGSAPADPIALTVPAGGVPAGSRVVVGIVYLGSAPSGITDTRGNTYALDATAPVMVEVGTFAAALWSAHIGTALQAGDTIAIAVAGIAAAVADAFTGVAALEAFDQAATATKRSTDVQLGPTGALAQIPALCVQLVANATPGITFTSAEGAGFTNPLSMAAFAGRVSLASATFRQGALRPVGASAGSRVPLIGSRHWPARLITVANLENNLFDRLFDRGGQVARGASPTFGVIAIATGDAGLDAWTGYHWDGREVTIRLGREGWALDEFGIVFRGAAADLTWDLDRLEIPLRDYGEPLTRPALGTVYTTPTALVGRRLPRAFGKPQNVTPVPVDPGTLIYQVHDGSVQAIPAVYDRAVALVSDGERTGPGALESWGQVPGRYVTDTTTGRFRLGATPTGPVTADVEGDDGGPLGFVQTAADVLRRLVTMDGVLTDDDLDLPAFTALNLSAPYPVSLYLTDDRPLAAVLDELMQSVGGFWTFTPERRLTVGRLAFATPVATVPASHIHALARVATDTPPWRLRLGYGRTWTVHGEADVAPGATAARRAFVTQPHRYAVHDLEATRRRRALATDDELLTLLNTAEDAASALDQLVSVIGIDRHRYDVVVSGWQFRLRVGQTITFAHPRFGLTPALQFLILGLTENTDTGHTALRLWSGPVWAGGGAGLEEGEFDAGGLEEDA